MVRKKKSRVHACSQNLVSGAEHFVVLFGSGDPSVVGFTLPVCKTQSTSAFLSSAFAGVSKACWVPWALNRGFRTYSQPVGLAP